MKKLLFIILALLAFNSSFAQDDLNTIKAKWQESIAAILQKQADSKNKTTQIRQRVVAFKDSSLKSTLNGLYLRDSTVFKYSGTKGSQFDFGTMSYRYLYNIPGVNVDTATILFYSGNSLKPSEKDIIHYASSAQKDTVVVQSYDTIHQIYVNKTRTSYAFDNANNITKFFNDNWDTTANNWKSLNVTFYLFAGNQKIADTTYNFINGIPSINGRHHYYYGASGNLDSSDNQYLNAGTWQTTSKTFYTYYANNLLKQSLINITTATTNQLRDSFGYTGGFTFYSYEKYTTMDVGSTIWNTSYESNKYVNSAGLVDSMIVFHPTNTYNRYYFTYNSYGNPVSMSEYVSGFFTGLEFRTFYYYETYNDNLAVKEVSTQSGVILYPNPATTSLSIQRNNFTPGESITIWSVMGQKMAQQTLENSNVVTVPVSTLNPGIYWLVLHNSDGSINARQPFIKK